MFIRVLGAAAGGGYPQWNCNHPNSRLARNKDYNAVTIIRSNGKISQIKKNKKSFIASIISGEIIRKLLINDKSLN